MLKYGLFDISSLGDATISQDREYEGGESPQRIKVTLRVKVEFFQDSFSDNYSLVQQLRQALRTQHDLLVWTNDDTNETYVSAPAVPVSNDLPEDPNGWGSYYQACHLVFSYYEHNLVTNNLPLVIKRAGDTGNLSLTNVQTWSESVSTERYSPLHSGRKMVTSKISAAGLLLADTTLSLDDQRTFLAKQKAALDELNGLECLIVFGDFFNQTVRVDEFTVQIDTAVNQLRYSFTAHYTLSPDETTAYAMVEFQVDQRETFTGEQFLDVSGKITASDESTARARLVTLTATVLTQYKYNAAQPIKQDTTANQISPPEDPAIFTELGFALSYRRWRTDNSDATFQATGTTQSVSLQNVRLWVQEYTANRFSEQRSQRRYAGGRIEAGGTIPGDMTLDVDARRTALLAGATALNAAMNSAEGTLKRGAFTQVVRIETFKAEINQALTGIEWSLTAVYSSFPSDAGYATVEFTVAQRDSVEDGEQYLVFGGRVWAQTEAAARAKQTAIRTSLLGTYQFTAAQQIRQESQANSVFANGDKTAAIAGEAADGTTFIELSWTEEYRQRKAGLLNWALKVSTRDEVPTGLRLTTYAGYVQATGATPAAAYAAAAAQAAALGANKQMAIGGNAFLRSSSLNQDTRQTRADNVTEFVRLEFSYEYQSKLAAGSAYMEVSMELATEAFGPDMESIGGYVVAVDFARAEGLYAALRALYTGRLVRGERTNESQVQAQNATGFTVQQLRLDFSFQVFRPKAAGKVSYKYGISISKDILSLQLNTRIHGSIYCDSLATAQTALAVLSLASYGSMLREEQDQDREYTSDSSDNFIKLDFDQQFTAKLTGISELLEMTVVEDVTYSGDRLVVQPTLKNAAGAGGYSVVQSVSVKEGSRTIRGTVSAAALTTCEAWGKKQRALLTGDKDGNKSVQPEQWTRNYDFVPRVEAVVNGDKSNVRIYKVEFVFSEILPNYPAPA